MSNGGRWAIALAGAAVVGVSPWLWWWSPSLLWVTCPLVVAWGMWLVAEYLRWARTLRQR